MAKPLPVPATPPSPAAARIIRSIEGHAEKSATTGDEYAQQVIDLLHLEAAIRALVNAAYYRAVSPTYGGVPFREMTRRTGLAKSAIQRRVNNGAEDVGGAKVTE